VSWLRKAGLHLGLFAVASGFALILWIVVADWLILPGFVRRSQVRELPDVTERPLEEARRILEQEGFELVLDEEREDADVPAGNIVSQVPAAFSTVKKGRRIYVVVSKGAQRCLVPDVMESSQRQAEVRLRQSGLSLGTVEAVESHLVPRGVVLAQDPLPRTEVIRGSAVNITVSLGAGSPDRVVPDLVGEFLDDAQQILESRGLKIGRVKYEPSMVHLPDTVLRQVPEAGQIVEKGHKIDLVVATL
jgi:serine/threonine-protein kinase